MSNDGRQLIQIETDEDPDSVKDRLSFYKGQRVLLIWPEDGTALTRKLDLVLIQREAMRRQIKLAFVTHDPQVIQHAAELNVSTFQTIGASERGRWKRGRTPVFTGRERRPTVEAPIEDEPDEPLPPPKSDEGRRRGASFFAVILRMVALGVFLGVGFGLFYFIVPTATVRVAPATQPLTIDVEIIVNTASEVGDIDIENAILPATRISVEIEETVTIPTTGAQSEGEETASGEVIFINQTANAVEIAPGTTLSTSAGVPILFRTTEEATLPAGVGSEVTVPVEAMPSSAGEIGNVGANMINTVIGELDEAVTVVNTTPTTGGRSRSIPAVSSNDRDRINTQINQLLQQRAFTEMQNLPQIGSSQYIILESLRITEERDEWTRYSAQPGELAETLTLTKRAIVEAFVIDMNLGQQIVFARMASEIPRGRVIDTSSITYEQAGVQLIDGETVFTMSGRARLIGQVNEDLLRNALVNLTFEEAVAYLRQNADIDSASSPEITLTPDIFGRLPMWAERITIEVIEP